MSTVQLVIVCLTLVALAWISTKREPAAARTASIVDVGQVVALHVGDGQAVRGKVCSNDAGIVILENASLLSGGQEEALGKRARVAEGSVELVQEL